MQYLCLAVIDRHLQFLFGLIDHLVGEVGSKVVKEGVKVPEGKDEDDLGAVHDAVTQIDVERHHVPVTRHRTQPNVEVTRDHDQSFAVVLFVVGNLNAAVVEVYGLFEFDFLHVVEVRGESDDFRRRRCVFVVFRADNLKGVFVQKFAEIHLRHRLLVDAQPVGELRRELRGEVHRMVEPRPSTSVVSLLSFKVNVGGITSSVNK